MMAAFPGPRRATRPRRTPLGRRLYDLRVRSGLRQSDAAAALSINGGRISEWEQGVRVPTDEELGELMALYQRAMSSGAAAPRPSRH